MSNLLAGNSGVREGTEDFPAAGITDFLLEILHKYRELGPGSEGGGHIKGLLKNLRIICRGQDNKGIRKVDFLLKGSMACSTTVAPYTCSGVMVKGRNVTVQARATELAGNVTTSSSITIGN